jgi:hypothetical protein
MTKLSYASVAMLGVAVSALGQGSLAPPGAPAPTGRTLTQVEPRTDISTLPGTATAVYSITVSGSYYLTSNLAGAAGKDTIVVSAPGVTIDLNGFSLLSTDAGRAAILATTGASCTVRNGRIIGGAYGVRGTTRLACYDLVVEGGSTLGIAGTADAILERCRISNAGLQLGVRGKVTDCTTTGSAGIFVDDDSVVTNCQTTAGGISGTDNVQISHCNVSNAPIFGINVNDRCMVSHCNVITSARAGILVRFRCRVEHCSVTDATGVLASGDGGFTAGIECILDSCTATSCDVPGFVVSSSTQLRNCLSTTNTGNGFSVGNQCRLVDCTASGNSGLGISLGNRGQASNCIANANNAGGIYSTGSGGILERCTAAANIGGAGLRVDTGTIRDCEVRETQGGAGIRSSTGSMILRNTSNSNGVAATPQNGFLIEGGRSRVEGNHGYNNIGFGIEVTNTASTNSVLVIGNSCGSNDLGEFSIGAGNAAGPIISPASVNTTTSPTANFDL